MPPSLAIAVAATVLSAIACAQRPELQGKAMQPGGEAIRGATIFVYTAAPKHGTSPI